MTVHVCTIVARNYLPQARVLAASVHAAHENARVTVLVIDDPERTVGENSEPFEVLTVEDLVGDAAEFRRMASVYEVLEYSTALKPWLLRTVLASGSGSAIYLDPDIQVFDDLSYAAELALSHELVLTPHATSPMPRDGKMVSESAILAAGVFNLGFIAVGLRCDAFLEFWMERLRRECIVDPQQMRFVDQRWIDFTPGMFEVAIIRDPGWNVAYWNLDARALAWTGDGYEVTGTPLKFFHFSGYSPLVPHMLSKHQVHPPRILLSEYPSVRRICNEYGRLLLKNGYGTTSNGVQYRWASMANGIHIDYAVRRLLRDAIDSADAGTAPYPDDPFTPAGADRLVAWMNEPGEVTAGPSRLTRYLAAVYACRPDVRKEYPDPQGADYEHFVAWARHEADAGRIDQRLVPSSSGKAGEVGDGRRIHFAGPDSLRPGVTVIGYLRAELGVGEWGRLATEAIEAAGIPHATVVSTATTSRQDHPFEGSRADRYAFDTNLLCVNADQVPFVRADLGPECFDGRYTIGQWAWELEEFPERWHGSFDLVDEIWAISEFTRQCLVGLTSKPVFAVPPAIVAPKVSVPIDRGALGLPSDGFIFLFTFDLLSILERKNPLGLIEAFRRAFPDAMPGGPRLVLKIINGDQRLADLEKIRMAAIDRPDVTVIDRYLTAHEQAALMSAADCYVSLHRSEGFGLTMAEAMVLGKPVIATAYSGNMDFMSPEIAHLVRWDYGAVPDGCEPYRPGARWAEPDLDHAAQLLRKVFDDPVEAARMGRRAQTAVRERHGLAARAKIVQERFHAIERRRKVAEGVDVSPRAELDDRLRELAAARPALDAPARRAAALTKFYRRVVLRAQRHHDDHQRMVNVALAERIEGVQREAGQIHSLSADVVRQLEELQVLRDQVRSLDQAVRATQADMGRTVVGHERAIADLRRGIQELEAGPMAELRRVASDLQGQIIDVRDRTDELRVVPFMDDPTELMVEDASGRLAIGYRTAAGRREHAYAGFEDTFRGSEEMIRDRQRYYVPLLSTHAPVLDVGCGRGEMLDLLLVSGTEAVGVDLDESMAERCRSKGHQVKVADAITYLGKEADGSLGAVFSAQVIEHLPYDQLVRFFAESYRVLARDGIFIAETVNPHAVAAFKTFWTDLTHRVPIFPEVAVSLCRSAGFEEAIVVFPNGIGDLEVDRWRQGEYAVLATRRSS